MRRPTYECLGLIVTSTVTAVFTASAEAVLVTGVAPVWQGEKEARRIGKTSYMARSLFLREKTLEDL